MLLLSLLACGSTSTRITRVLNLEADLTTGTELYEGECARCHGPQAVGDTAPSLVPLGQSDRSVLRTIIEGNAGMGGYFAWPDQDLADVMGYLDSLE